MSNPAPLCLCETIYRHLCPEHVECSASPYARVRMLAYALLHEMRPAAHTAQVSEVDKFTIIQLESVRDHLRGGACDQAKAAEVIAEAVTLLRRLAEQGSGAK